MEEETNQTPQKQSNNLKWIILVVMAVVVVGFGVWLFTKSSGDSSNNSSTSSSSQSNVSSDSQQSSSQNSAAPKTFSADDVAMHNNASDCWMIISDKVYDVTEFVSRHPGGSEIIRGCGIDATSLFTQRETADGEKVGSGTPHSSSAQSQLNKYYVGNLHD